MLNKPERDKKLSTMGLVIFDSVAAATRAGFEILSPHPDLEGFLHARTRTPKGWALALVLVK